MICLITIHISKEGLQVYLFMMKGFCSFPTRNETVNSLQNNSFVANQKPYRKIFDGHSLVLDQNAKIFSGGNTDHQLVPEGGGYHLRWSDTGARLESFSMVGTPVPDRRSRFSLVRMPNIVHT